MNTKIMQGTFRGNRLTYLSKNGKYLFQFEFIQERNSIAIKCLSHPSFNGKSSNPAKTHLYHSNFLCFIRGKEPKTMDKAKELASQWAEYFLDYRKTGKVQH